MLVLFVSGFSLRQASWLAVRPSVVVRIWTCCHENGNEFIFKDHKIALGPNQSLQKNQIGPRRFFKTLPKMAKKGTSGKVEVLMLKVFIE